MSRGRIWLEALTGTPGKPWRTASVIYADAEWHGSPVRAICVTPNRDARFARARQGQFGIEEGWAVASCLRATISEDLGGTPRAILAIVDVPGQAFGFHEEALGLHASLAASVKSYAAARSAGHPIIALVVGKAISGAFLAHGLQAGFIFALDDDAIEVHVMSSASVARVTKRTHEEVIQLEKVVPSIARNVRAFASLGGVDRLIVCNSADSPDKQTVESVRIQLRNGFEELRNTPREPRDRLRAPVTHTARAMSIRVRERLEAEWD